MNVKLCDAGCYFEGFDGVLLFLMSSLQVEVLLLGLGGSGRHSVDHFRRFAVLAALVVFEVFDFEFEARVLVLQMEDTLGVLTEVRLFHVGQKRHQPLVLHLQPTRFRLQFHASDTRMLIIWSESIAKIPQKSQIIRKYP